jgi:hypothetical protein
MALRRRADASPLFPLYKDGCARSFPTARAPIHQSTDRSNCFRRFRETTELLVSAKAVVAPLYFRRLNSERKAQVLAMRTTVLAIEIFSCLRLVATRRGTWNHSDLRLHSTLMFLPFDGRQSSVVLTSRGFGRHLPLVSRKSRLVNWHEGGASIAKPRSFSTSRCSSRDKESMSFLTLLSYNMRFASAGAIFLNNGPRSP